MKLHFNLISFLLVLLFIGCSDSDQQSTKTSGEAPVDEAANDVEQIFQLISPDRSGLDFYNNITETQEYNYFKFQYTYNGAGVAISDINNDGLDDIYLVGNQTADKLFLNKGDMTFEDITSSSGISNDGGFNFGVTMVDINLDGYQDIYLCRSGHRGLDRERANLLFINNGDLTFTESAKAYGLDDTGHSIIAEFFDYDNDKDLDMYVTNHPVDYGQNLGDRLKKMKDPDEVEMDRLYRNNGDGTFSDVTREAGLVNYGHGLGLVIWDVNEDGWDDIMVANDYQSSDWVYINNQDGTFTDKMKMMFPHIPYYSMGIDVADINNDGLMDLNIVEMLPDSYKRRLMNLSDLSEKNYYVFNEVGFHHQYTRNCFYLNTGMDHFSDIALMTGMEATDWSWATLIADFDNDGLQDVLITNGYLRDMQDKDYIKRSKVLKDQKRPMTKDEFNKICQSNKLRNYLYRNKGDLEFESIAKTCGLEHRSFSNGAAYSDLDNDGDLDLVINNVNLQLDPDPAFLYENLSSNGSNFIKIDFKGPGQNPDGIGTKAIIKNSDETLVRELRRTRGFESAVPNYLHFGLGDISLIERLIIVWPDGRYEEANEVKSGSILSFDYSNATGSYEDDKSTPLFVEVEDMSGLDFDHEDKVLNEFDFEKQLPFRLGMQGPSSCQGDVNGDGLIDVFFTAAHDYSDELYLQTSTGFELSRGPWEEFAFEEHIVSEFVDIDNDGDLDLFIGAGGIERGKSSPEYLDRLFLNNGQGEFIYAESALPRMMSSTSCAKFGDMDGDGDFDLFIGSRSVAGSYGTPPNSFLLRNENGQFVSIAPEADWLSSLGMVSDAEWLDVEGDGDNDLIIVGEWSAPKLFVNNDGKLFPGEGVIPDIKGFWRSIEKADLDGDGLHELILGNSGTNSKYAASSAHPLRMYTGNLDTDGKRDIMIAYKQGQYYHPDRTFTYLSEQFPFLKQKYTFYEDAAGKSLEQIFGRALANADLYEINEMRSVILKWNGNSYDLTPLPKMAQLSFINDIEANDLDSDGDLDLIVAGNELFTPIQTGSYDASIGCVLINDGKGNLSALEPTNAGLRLKYWVKGLSMMEIGANSYLLAWRNDKEPLLFKRTSSELTSD
ncbi:MAG: VCBS repeat-containing protein [Flavobacteriales bacterium]|nr:VCBS repeat-containing protein [Flavobacteriales bacterium]